MRAILIPSSYCLLLLLCSISGLLLFLDSISAQSDDIWQLNQTYPLNQSELPLLLADYPGSQAFLITSCKAFAEDQLAVCLCFLSSPSPSESSSISSSSPAFTLSIYVRETASSVAGVVVWTANRDAPILGTNVSLTLQSDGNLVLLGDDPDVPVWSTNTSNQGVSTMELSVDPVSLTLYTRNRTIVWQSAAHPTDTLVVHQHLLPGRKLDSWASSSSPSSGLYSLVIEAGGIALYVSMPDPQPYWVWGLYGFNDTLSSIKHTCEPGHVSAFLDYQGLLLQLTPLPRDNASNWPPFCSHPLHYQIPPILLFFFPFPSPLTASNLTLLRMESDGNLRAYAVGSRNPSPLLDLFESDNCRLPNICGPYGVCIEGSQCSCPVNESIFTPINSSSPSLGCRPLNNNNLTCSSATDSTETEQAMLPLGGVYYFANDYSLPLALTSQAACVHNCSQNCSCVAAFWRVEDRACHHVHDQIGSLRGALNQSNYFTFLKVDISRQHDGITTHTSATVVIVSVISFVVGLLVLVMVFLCCWHKKHSEVYDEEADAVLDALPGLPNRFSYEELLKITNGFQQQLGKGGFGPVYAGMLPNGTKVAVKKLQSVRQGNKEFRSEVAIMGGIHHNNLLRLIGFCAQKGQRLLVYEYMENGSLDAWLFGDTCKKSQLTWELRCKIAVGTARGLRYLHEDCREKIIHLDIKPQNILLGEGFEAKVADFGLSRFIDRKETHVMTTMRGTPGYLAPDWFTKGLIDEKCDVYSFGMLLMEIISGRKNLHHPEESMEEIYYPEWAFWQAQREDENLRKLSDAIIATEEDLLQLRRMINTAFTCILEDPALRPSMYKVVLMLQGDVPIEKLELSSLHQGLIFALKNPSSCTKARIEQAVQEVMGSLSPSLCHDSSTLVSGR